MSVTYELLQGWTALTGRLGSFVVTPSGTPQAIVVGMAHSGQSTGVILEDGAGAKVVTYGDRLYIPLKLVLPDKANTGAGAESGGIQLWYAETEEGIPPGSQRIRIWSPAGFGSQAFFALALYNDSGWLEVADSKRRSPVTGTNNHYVALTASVTSRLLAAMCTKQNGVGGHTPLTSCTRVGGGHQFGPSNNLGADLVVSDERSTGLNTGWDVGSNTWDDAIVGYTAAHIAAGTLLAGRIPYLAAKAVQASQTTLPGTEGISSDPDLVNGVWMPGGPGVGDLVYTVASIFNGSGAVGAKTGWNRHPEGDLVLNGKRVVVDWRWLQTGDTQTADYAADGVTDLQVYVVKGADLHKTTPLGNIVGGSGFGSTFTQPANTGDNESGRGSYFVGHGSLLQSGSDSETNNARPQYMIGISSEFANTRIWMGHAPLWGTSYPGGTVGPTGSGAINWWALTIELQSRVLVLGTKIVLEDPGGGAPPAGMDDQFVGNGSEYPSTNQKHIPDHHLRAVDSSYHKIIRSVAGAATSEIWVENDVTADFAEDDLVSIHPAADGTLLHRLFSPRITEFGRVAREKDLDTLSGRGNYAKNPELKDWADTGDSWGCQADGDHSSGNTLNIKRAPANQVFAPGTRILATRLVIYPGPALQVIHKVFTVDSPGATADGAGDAAVPVVESLGVAPLITDNTPLACCTLGLPDDWTDPGTVGFAFYRPTNVTAQITGLSALNGSGEDDSAWGGFVRLDGGTAGVTRIYAGDRVTIGSSVRVALHDALADASGHLHVVLNQPGTWSATDAATVTRPQFLHSNAGAVLMMPSFGSQTYVQSPLSPVHFIEATPKLWHSFWGEVWNPTDGAIVVATATGKKKPKEALWDGSAEVDSLEYSEEGSDFGAFTVGAGSEYGFLIRSAYEMTVTDSFAARPYGAWLTQTSGGGGAIDQRGWLWTMVRAIELSLAVTIGDDETEPVRGFGANLAHQEANRLLLTHHGWDPEITLSYAEIVDASGMSPEQVRAVRPGQEFRVLSPGKRLDALYVLQQIHWEIREYEMIPSYVLGFRHELLTEQIARGLTSTGVATATVVSGGSSSVDAYSKSESDTLLADAAAVDEAARDLLLRQMAHRVLVGF